MTYSYRESIRLATAPNSTMSWFSPSAVLSRPAFNASDSCNCSVADIRDPYMWASTDGGGTSNTTLYLLAGGGDACSGGVGSCHIDWVLLGEGKQQAAVGT